MTIPAFVPKVLCSFGGDKLFKRESFTDSQFNSARSGILGVNGNPTTCEIGLLSPVVGLVAAGCIVTDDNGVKDNSTKYSVYLYMGDQKVDPTIYDLNTENIFIPGTYDKATAHANLAVIRFNGDAKDTYQPHGSLGEYGVAESSYTSRLMDMNLKKWNMASIMGQPNDYFDVCKGINPLYEANSYFLTCNSDTIDSIYNKDCRMPYGAVYTKKGENDDIVLIAIYTHTIVMGTNECTDRRLNFFTYAHNFLPYASWVTGETFNIYKDKNRTTLSVSSEPDMTINAGSSTSFGGMLTLKSKLRLRLKLKSKLKPKLKLRLKLKLKLKLVK
ncbi:hypothetical protein LPJ64_000966 [Coemansia asiatica]|uniref:Uncharacterized protein n=1 Tax=Coemansia asiatica TaxID=1052880 RepID=A0A9W7XPW3_9FUNG|nr:hypothetical protein LPJ64_000966 [Coemansia asiatica]